MTGARSFSLRHTLGRAIVNSLNTRPTLHHCPGGRIGKSGIGSGDDVALSTNIGRGSHTCSGNGREILNVYGPRDLIGDNFG